MHIDILLLMKKKCWIDVWLPIIVSFPIQNSSFASRNLGDGIFIINIQKHKENTFTSVCFLSLVLPSEEKEDEMEESEIYPKFLSEMENGYLYENNGLASCKL